MMVANDFGLTLSIPKTKSTPVGKELTREDKTPLSVRIEYICEFPYLGSVIASNGRMDLDVSRSLHPKGMPLWLAASTSTVWWTQTLVERPD